MAFHHDLRFGNKAEQAVIKFFVHHGYLATMNTGVDPITQNKISLSAYDIKLYKDGKYKFIEVKSDRLANRTENVAIELSRFCGCLGYQPTGVMRSQADFIVYKIAGIFYLADRRKLQDSINKALDDDNRKIIHKVLDGGQGKRTRIALVKRGVFMRLCECYWEYDTEKVTDLRNKKG